MARNVTAASSDLLSDRRAHLSMVETSRVDFHEYFTGFKHRDGPFHDKNIIVQGFILFLVIVL